MAGDDDTTEGAFMDSMVPAGLQVLPALLAGVPLEPLVGMGAFASAAWPVFRSWQRERMRKANAELGPTFAAREARGENTPESAAAVLDGYEKIFRAIDDRAVLPLARLTREALTSGRDAFYRNAGRAFAEATKAEWDGLELALGQVCRHVSGLSGEGHQPVAVFFRFDHRAIEVRTSDGVGHPLASLDYDGRDVRGALEYLAAAGLGASTTGASGAGEVVIALGVARRLRAIWEGEPQL